MTDARPPRRETPTGTTERPKDASDQDRRPGRKIPPVAETGGQRGPEPTRYGDWEKDGRCTDF